MTSFAFVLGCVPLWTASGAGSVSRQIMGTTVIGGMLAATLIAVFIIPVCSCRWRSFRRGGRAWRWRPRRNLCRRTEMMRSPISLAHSEEDHGRIAT
jgi:AcrB/AcrD/AcrF family